jgi:hypothetical protein
LSYKKLGAAPLLEWYDIVEQYCVNWAVTHVTKWYYIGGNCIHQIALGIQAFAFTIHPLVALIGYVYFMLGWAVWWAVSSFFFYVFWKSVRTAFWIYIILFWWAVYSYTRDFYYICFFCYLYLWHFVYFVRGGPPRWKRAGRNGFKQWLRFRYFVRYFVKHFTYQAIHGLMVINWILMYIWVVFWRSGVHEYERIKPDAIYKYKHFRKYFFLFWNQHYVKKAEKRFFWFIIFLLIIKLLQIIIL